MIEDELRDAGRVLTGDVLAGGDWFLAELGNSSACPTCGTPEPVRIEGAVCSECSDFPRCVHCGRWVGDGTGWLPGHEVIEWDGAEVAVCLPCWREID